jgi:hypothetical protein
MQSFHAGISESFTAEIRGEGALFKKLANNYRHMRKSTGEEPDVVCTCTYDIDVSPDTILGSNVNHTAREDNRFIIRDQGNIIVIDDSWETIKCTPTSGNGIVGNILEGMGRIKAVENEKAMIHASGFVYAGETFILPAWRHTGKTNTALHFLTKGASYLADDRLWIDANGYAYPFPVSMNIQPYNLKSFPELSTTLIEDYRMLLGHKTDEFVTGRSAKLVRALNLFNQNYIKPDFGTVHPTSIFSSEIPPKKSIDHMILLASSSAELPHVEKITKRELVHALRSINTEEFNHILQKLGTQYDILFPEHKSMFRNTRDIEKIEKDIFKKAVDRSSIHKIHLPRQFQWSDKVKTKLESIFTEITEL